MGLLRLELPGQLLVEPLPQVVQVQGPLPQVQELLARLQVVLELPEPLQVEQELLEPLPTGLPTTGVPLWYTCRVLRS